MCLVCVYVCEKERERVEYNGRSKKVNKEGDNNANLSSPFTITRVSTKETKKVFMDSVAWRVGERL